jgi:hypothetical protein
MNMQLKIKQDAAKLFYKTIPAHIGLTQHQIDYGHNLSLISGLLVTVETDHLFDDQYNIVEENLRVFDYMVERVIDDERPYHGKCAWCGKTQVLNRSMTCSACDDDHPNMLNLFPVNLMRFPGIDPHIDHHGVTFSLSAMTTENACYEKFVRTMRDINADVLFHANGENVYVRLPIRYVTVQRF